MNFALSVIVKTTVLLAFASLVTYGLRRASASTKHAVWATVLLCTLVLPVASLLLPELAVPVLPESNIDNVPAAVTPQKIESTRARAERAGPPRLNSPPSSPGIQPVSSQGRGFLPATRDQTLLLVWASGACVVLLRLFVGTLTIHRLARNSIRVEDKSWGGVLDELRSILRLKRPVCLRISNQTIPPMTWGIFRPVVLLPATAVTWTPGRQRLVLAHELAHVRRNDGFLQIVLQAVCSIYWFNPMIWFAARRLRIERECACDDQVLKLGADGDDYADHLLQVARTLNPAGGLSLATVAMAHRSQLETRLLAILDNRTRRYAVSRLAAALLLMGVGALTLLASTVQLTAKPALLLLHFNFAVPGIPADFATAPDAQQIPVPVHGSVREFGADTPIAGALITLFPLEDVAEESSPSYEAETRSDGTFEILDVPAGQYRLLLSREGYAGIHGTLEPGRLTVFNGRRPEDVDLYMMPVPAISGRIFDEKGRSKSEAYVELMRPTFRDGRRTLVASDISMVTDDNGEYRLFGLPPGEYYLRVRPRAGTADFLPVYFPGVTDASYATPISVVAGADISGIDLSLTRGNLHSVRLKVQVAPPVPENPELSFYITPLRSSGGASAGAIQFHSVGRDTYVSPLLAPGSYEIEVYLRDPDPIRWARTTVEVVNRDVDAGTLLIGSGAWIRGHVTAAESLPVSVRRGQLLVILRPVEGSIFLLPSAQVADDGSFMIPRVPERRFRVELTGLPPEVYLASAQLGGHEVLNSGFVAVADAETPLDLSIASSGGVVAGVVRGTKDEPIANGTVVLIPSNKENLNLYRTASTDQFGVFSITGVPPGDYGVLAWSGERGKTYLDPVFLKAVENQAAKVVVQRGFTNTINVRAIAP